MASTQVIDVKMSEEHHDVSPAVNHHSSSFTLEDKSVLANSSFENSPLLDREKFLRYSARSRDEFWDALSSNYDYLMDDGLIATCREASSDLSLDDEKEIPEGSFTQFIEQFKWLHDLLHNIQVAKEGGNDSPDTKILEEQQKVAYLCKLFNDQAQRLSERYPDMKDEVHRHLNRLNNKWKAVEQSVNPNKVKSPSKDCVFNEIANRMRSVRKWLREIETRLIPVNLATNWTVENLEKRYREQQELQKEIEGKSKHISSLLNLCEHLKGNVQFGQNSLIPWDAERIRKVANNLEHRWHTLWLKSLECHCILEELMQSYGVDSDLEKSFTEEPLKKYPRLSNNCEELLLLENELKDKISYKMEDIFIDDNLCCDPMQQTDLLCPRGECSKTDKGVMVGDTGIAELKAECQRANGKFEIIQDVGYSSETSAHLSNDEKLDSPEAHLTQKLDNKSYLSLVTNKVVNNLNESTSRAPSKLYLPPDKYPSVSLKTLHILSEDKPLFNSKYGSVKAVPDSFYKVTSVDDEVLQESAGVPEKIDVPSNYLVSENVESKETVDSKIKKVSNDISSLKLESNSHAQPSTENVNETKAPQSKSSFLADSYHTPYSITKRNKKTVKNHANTKGLEPNELRKKSARVQEWLNTCQPADGGTSDVLVSTGKNRNLELLNRTTDSSCDASGECTTESDSEKSNVSDINNSIALSQSFTGSIETVVPVLQEENGVVQSDRAGSTEPLSGVRMRKKKRINRERPWSVTDVHQSQFISSLVPHSTSESALDLLYSAQDTKKLGSKKSNTESNKRLSLTDVSTLSCPSIKSLKTNKIISKNFNSKLNCTSEKPPSRRKKGLGSDKGSDKYDSASTSKRESSSKDAADLLKPVTTSVENNAEKALECSSLETSMVSESEKFESALNTEDQGSISWDEYQDPPYLSEPYSEQTADEDEVKKLINFGDDYRAMLGSYSDASSISLKAPISKTHKTRSKSYWRKGSSQESRDSLMSDSNSDSEDFQNMLKTSSHALQFVSNALKENTQKMTLFSSEFAELVATCQTNLCHLHAIHNEFVSGSELEAVSKEDILKLQDLIKEWEALQVKLLTLSRNDNEQKPKNAGLEAATLEVHCSLASLKEKLNAIASSIAGAGGSAVSLSQLEQNIQILQTGLSNLHETKESVLSVSARILRLIAEGGGATITPLRESATKLYQQWEDVYELNGSQLTKLQALKSHWHEPAESEMNSSSETTIQWHPVQVGSSLPTPQISAEEFFQNTAAEVQVADQHDVLFEIETESEEMTIECILEKNKFSDAICLLNPPALHTESFELEKKTNGAEVDDPTLNSKKTSCFWRTLRASVPIQFALVILYCMSCLMEPHCCENMNNYDFSLFPHLRYLRGPPPV